MKIRKICYQIAFFSIGFLLMFSVKSFSAEPNKKGEIFSAYSKEVVISSDDEPLRLVLRDIEKKSGIHLELNKNLDNEKITRQVSAANWITAIRNFLEDFNLTELGGEKGSINQIWVISKKYSYSTNEQPRSGKTAQSEKIQYSPLVSKKKPVNAINLSISQLNKIIKAYTNRPISSKIFQDPGLREFLKANNIHSSKDWLLPGWAQRVRTIAKNERKRIIKSRNKKEIR